MLENKPQLAFLPHVDGLRAIAVLSVVLYHLNPAWLPGGFSGVDVFFVISGFIVSASVGSINRMKLGSFMALFYARRILRILPALLVCVLITTLLTALIIPNAWLSFGTQQTGLYALFGLSNFILARTENDYFSPRAEFNPFTHTWSLGVEEQFYLIFPLLFFAWTFRGKWLRITTLAFALALMVSLGYSAFLGSTNKTAAFYMITSRFWELAAGVLLYQVMTLSGRRFDLAQQASPSWFTPAAVASLGLLAYGAVVSQPGQFPFPGAIPSVLGTLGLLYFLHGQPSTNPLMVVLGSRPMLFIGRISYSLYLWHWPVFVLFRWTVGLESPLQRIAATVLAFALAILSYFWVETPFRRSAGLRRAPRFAVVAGGLMTIGLSVWGATQINDAQTRISLSSVVRQSDDWFPQSFGLSAPEPRCPVQGEFTTLERGVSLRFSSPDCPLADPAAPRIFAIGDSHAMAYEGLFKGYVMQTGAPVTIYNNGGCSFLSMQPWDDGDACRANAEVAINTMLAEIRPGDVVLLASLRLPRFADQWVRFNDELVEHNVFSDWAVKGRDEAAQAAAMVLPRLHEKGAHVVFEAPKPIFKSPAFRCAETYQQTNPICRDGLVMDKAELERLRQPVLQTMQRLAQEMPGVSIWDPFPVLCAGSEQCSATQDGRPLFFDGDHISGYGNQVVLPSFQRFMATLPNAAETAVSAAGERGQD